MLGLSSGTTGGQTLAASDVSEYLLTPPRMLREACQALGHDDRGRYCAGCCVRDFCDSQAARAGLPPRRRWC